MKRDEMSKIPPFFFFLSPFISFYLFFLSLPYQQSTQTRTPISASRRSSLAYSSSPRVRFAASLRRGRSPWCLPSSACRPASASRRPRPHRRLIFNLRSGPVCPHRPAAARPCAGLSARPTTSAAARLTSTVARRGPAPGFSGSGAGVQEMRRRRPRRRAGGKGDPWPRWGPLPSEGAGRSHNFQLLLSLLPCLSRNSGASS